MVFGEIVEPSTRALIDDDYEEYPEYESPVIEWKGSQQCPATITTLIFIETEKIQKLFKSYLLQDAEPITTIQNGNIEIYEHQLNTTFLAFYKRKDLTTGQIIESLSEWIMRASDIYCITSEPLAAYQSLELQHRPETLIRVLTNKPGDLCHNYKKLEPPNLITGLGADVLSYCLHTRLNKGALFAIYMDNSPLDSINTEQILNLMKSLKLNIKTSKTNLNPPQSNLYL